MFESLRSKIKPQSNSKAAEARMRATQGSTSAELAASMLIAPTALMQLTLEEARIIVSFMTPRKVAAGTTFITEGDKQDTGVMFLLLDGDVTVESLTVSRRDPRIVNVIGAGSLLGEMSLLDGGARLASCVASTNLLCATLTRTTLERLTDQEPRTAAKLLLAISTRIAERLRDVTDKVRLYSDLVQVMQQEIDSLMPTPDRDNDGAAPPALRRD